MKVKSVPEDFIVREVSPVTPEDSGEFGLYLLEKRGWNTTDLLKRIARQARVPYSLFAYGGRKDRHACTSQFVTVRHPEDLSTTGEDWSFRLLGRTTRPMGPDLIAGNQFEITLRALTAREAGALVEALEAVGRTGFENYFDDQRFAGVDPERGFIAERILKGHWKGSLEIYLTGVRPDDPGPEKARRRAMRERWGDWEACLPLSCDETERKILKRLIADPRDYVGALRVIPREEMSMFFAAYQAFIWNEVLRRIVVRLGEGVGEAILVHEGKCGRYLFLPDLEGDARAYLTRLAVPLPGARAVFPDPQVERIYLEVLSERGIHPGRFNLRKLRQAYFKSTPRDAHVSPQGLRTTGPEVDPLNPSSFTLKVAFTLPRGSYGTMLVKRAWAEVKTASVSGEEGPQLE